MTVELDDWERTYILEGIKMNVSAITDYYTKKEEPIPEDLNQGLAHLVALRKKLEEKT